MKAEELCQDKSIHSQFMRIKNLVKQFSAELIGDFIDGVACTAAVGDFYADRISFFRLCDIFIVYLH